MFKIEFLTPEKGRGSDKAVSIRPLKIRATPLRYLQMLSEQPLKMAKEDYVFFIPNPWTLAFHKILISQNRKAKDKKEKDLLQAAGLLRGIKKKPEMLKKALSYLNTLPDKWKKYIENKIIEYVPDFFSELKQARIQPAGFVSPSEASYFSQITELKNTQKMASSVKSTK